MSTETYFNRETYTCSTCGGDKPNDWCMTCGGTGVVTIAQAGVKRINIYQAMAIAVLFCLDAVIGWYLYPLAMKFLRAW